MTEVSSPLRPLLYKSRFDRAAEVAAKVGAWCFGLVATACKRLILYVTNRYGNNNAAYIFQFIGVTAYFFVSLNLKTNPNLDVVVSFLYRGPVVIISNFLISRTQKIKISLTGREFLYLNFRGFLVAAGDLVFFACFKTLSQSVIYILNTTTPLFVFILNYFMFHSKISCKEMFFVALSFVGVIFVIAPNAVTGLFGFGPAGQPESAQSATASQSMLETIIWGILMLLSRLGVSFAMLMNKIVNINTIEISYYLGWYMQISGCLLVF